MHQQYWRGPTRLQMFSDITMNDWYISLFKWNTRTKQIPPVGQQRQNSHLHPSLYRTLLQGFCQDAKMRQDTSLLNSKGIFHHIICHKAQLYMLLIERFSWNHHLCPKCKHLPGICEEFGHKSFSTLSMHQRECKGNHPSP